MSNKLNRIYHPYWKWECYKAGFYASSCPGNIPKEHGILMYKSFLSNIPAFIKSLNRVISEWPNSCEQFFTNSNLNRIAWLGQASMCIETGIPSMCRSGFKLLSFEKQTLANRIAEITLINWIESNA